VGQEEDGYEQNSLAEWLGHSPGARTHMSVSPFCYEYLI